MRIMSWTITWIVRGRPGPRRWVYVHFCATDVRYHRISVSGVTNVSSSLSALRPNAYALRASRRRSASVNRRRRPPRRSFSNRFSAFRYSIASSCRRLIQPASSVSRKCSGWMERSIAVSIAGYNSSSAPPPRLKRAVRIVGYYGLAVAGAPPALLLENSEPHTFAGEARTSVDLVGGTIVDLNVMSRRCRVRPRGPHGIGSLRQIHMVHD